MPLDVAGNEVLRRDALKDGLATIGRASQDLDGIGRLDGGPEFSLVLQGGRTINSSNIVVF